MTKKRMNISSLQLLLVAVGSFTLTAILALLASYKNMFGFQLIGAFGASIAIVIALPESDVAKVKNIIIGSIVSALIGIVIVAYVDTFAWLKISIAVSFSITVMLFLDVFHPPGGAIALILVVNDNNFEPISYISFMNSVLLGAVIISLFAYIYKLVLKTKL